MQLPFGHHFEQLLQSNTNLQKILTERVHREQKSAPPKIKSIKLTVMVLLMLLMIYCYTLYHPCCLNLVVIN